MFSPSILCVVELEATQKFIDFRLGNVALLFKFGFDFAWSEALWGNEVTRGRGMLKTSKKGGR
jgi:hypothetical protein